jgi:hypothetical protein
MSVWAALALFALSAEPSVPSPTDGPRSSGEQRQAFAQKAAAGYRFRLAGQPVGKVLLEKEPLLRWTNQVVREDDGMLFLWSDGSKGRPVAAAQFFLVGPQWNHEFQSLSDGPFEARYADDDWTWNPAEGGIEWKTAGRVTEDAAVQRLRRMKSLVGPFTAAVDPDEAFQAPEQLRLLTTPVYRYASPEAGIIDGAIFAFVQGTNPEILILVEAHDDGSSGKTWRYAFARMSCFYLRVYRDGQIVWRTERAPVPTPNAASTYFFRPSVQIDGSAEIATPRADEQE